MLGDSDIDRYSRQILLPEIGGRGQVRLQQSSISVVGGEAAAIALLYLQAAGVGRIETALTPDATMGLRLSSSGVAALDPTTADVRNQIALIEAAAGTHEQVQQRSAAGLWTVYLGGESSGGRLRTFAPGEWPNLPPFTGSGLHAVEAAILGSLAATEVIRLLLGRPATMHGQWLIYEATGNTLTQASA